MEKPPTVSDVHWISWLLGTGTTLVLILVGWGFKDIKKRFDMVLELDKAIFMLTQEVTRLAGEVDKLKNLRGGHE